MGTQVRPTSGRSQRDELEQLQEELLGVQRQSAELPRENAELRAQVAHLEKEVRSLREARDAARAGWAKPLPSLPAQLVPPFFATPSRRALPGRMRLALRSWREIFMMTIVLNAYLMIFSRRGPQWSAMLLGFILLWFVLRSHFSQHHEDDDERLAWIFEDEGFGQIGEDKQFRQVFYSEVRKVEVKQGALLRRFGLGSVRVTWAPAAPTVLGKDAGFPNRVLDIDLIDDPHRLAAWLLARAEEARKQKPGGGHAR